MVIVLIIAVIGLLVWINKATVRLFHRRQAGLVWWAILWAAWLAGGALGVWLGFFLEYQLSPDFRVFSAPVPAAFFHLEGPPGHEGWVDFVSPITGLLAASNVAIVTLLAACPIGLIFWFGRRPKLTQSEGHFPIARPGESG